MRRGRNWTREPDLFSDFPADSLLKVLAWPDSATGQGPVLGASCASGGHKGPTRQWSRGHLGSETRATDIDRTSRVLGRG
jgi:hypothetical protein